MQVSFVRFPLHNARKKSCIATRVIKVVVEIIGFFLGPYQTCSWELLYCLGIRDEQGNECVIRKTERDSCSVYG